jgi:hypothetical protein
MSNVTFEIRKHIATLSTNQNSGWTKELNLVSWNGRPEKLEIREWSPDHTKMSRGVSFDDHEGTVLAAALSSYFGRA